MEVLNLEASGRKVDKLETFQLLLIVHEDKYRPIVEKGKTVYGQEAFGSIEQFMLKHGKEATQCKKIWNSLKMQKLKEYVGIILK